MPHERLGKVIVAADDHDVAELEKLYKTGLANGVELDWVDRAFVAAREPHVRAVAAIYSPGSGIVGS